MRIRIGVLGTARIARAVVPQIQASDNAEAAAVASRSIMKAQQFAAEFSIPQAWGSYEELLASDTIDAVYIPLPPSLHCEWTVRAAESGKHVLCEKPLGVTARDVLEMINACRRNKVVLLDGVMWYHTARAARMKEFVSSGALGTVRQVTSAFTFPGDSLSRENLRFNDSLGGGSLLDVGWYCVGVSLWMLAALPQKVFATAQWQNSADMHLNGLMWFPQNAMASIECGFTAIRRRWVEIAGTKASLVCDDFSRPWDAERPRFWIHDADGKSTPAVVPHPPIERCLIDAFCSLVRENSIDHDWLLLSLQTQQVCDALRRSAVSGRVEAVAPEQ